MDTMNALDRIWSDLASADRVSLLGHDRDELSAADKMRLAKIAATLHKRDRHNRSRKTGRSRPRQPTPAAL